MLTQLLTMTTTHKFPPQAYHQSAADGVAAGWAGYAVPASKLNIPSAAVPASRLNIPSGSVVLSESANLDPLSHTHRTLGQGEFVNSIECL